MKLIGKLKKQVDEAANMAEKRSLIEEAGMKLTDEELDQVAGGGFDWERLGVSIPNPDGPADPVPQAQPANGDPGHFFDN